MSEDPEIARVGWGLDLAAIVLFVVGYASVDTWPPRTLLIVAYLALGGFQGLLMGIARSRTIR